MIAKLLLHFSARSYVRVFVSEYISSGVMSGNPLPASLLLEGRAMLAAIVSDLLAISDVRVTTTLDHRLKDARDFQSCDTLQIEWVRDAATARASFKKLTGEADAVLVIAPETDGLLRDRVERVLDAGKISLNCLPSAIDLCGDKLRLADHLIACGIPTIPTRTATFSSGMPHELLESDCVVKPRDGAGSWLTFRLKAHDTEAWNLASQQFTENGASDRAILQSWIGGQALSIAVLCGDGGEMELLPIGQQCLSESLQYEGGSIPADLTASSIAAIEQVVRRTCQVVTGLRGYVGMDLLLPNSDPLKPLVVEINPRLTTSYVGYRRLCRDNIAEQLILRARSLPSSPLRWNVGVIRFTPSEPIPQRMFLR